MLSPAIIGLAVVLAAIGIFAVVGHVHRRWTGAHDTAETFQALITGVAILVAGYWYFVERRDSPHAEIEQTALIVPLEGKQVMIEAKVKVKNVGSTLLRLRHIDAKLEELRLTRQHIDEMKPIPYDKWPDSFMDGTQMYRVGTMLWPAPRYFNAKIEYDLEPGESDTIQISFLVSCDVRFAKVTTQLEKYGARDRWWKAVYAVSTIKACRTGTMDGAL